MRFRFQKKRRDCATDVEFIAVLQDGALPFSRRFSTSVFFLYKICAFGGGFVVDSFGAFDRTPQCRMMRIVFEAFDGKETSNCFNEVSFLHHRCRTCRVSLSSQPSGTDTTFPSTLQARLARTHPWPFGSRVQDWQSLSIRGMPTQGFHERALMAQLPVVAYVHHTLHVYPCAWVTTHVKAELVLVHLRTRSLGWWAGPLRVENATGRCDSSHVDNGATDSVCRMISGVDCGVQVGDVRITT